MSPLSVRITAPEDVCAAQAIIRLGCEVMRDRFGLEHWIPPYPLERLQRDALTKAVYAVVEHGAWAGTFTTGTQGIDYLPAEFWADAAASALCRFYARLGYVERGRTAVTDLQGRRQHVAIFEKAMLNLEC